MTATIHLQVPAALKGRWIRASRARGMRLSDWIIDAVEAHMQRQLTTITIPDDVDFADLHLARDPETGDVEFDWAPIEHICRASGLDVAMLREGPEDNVSGLLVAWYQQHLAHGGARDPVQDDLMREVEIEERAGQSFSLPPGRA